MILIFGTRSLILYSSFKFLCLGSKNIQIIIFIMNMLRGCSMRIQNTPRATQRNPIGSYKTRTFEHFYNGMK
jgi:hypothetical protein